jgi:hypothetical protein
MPMVFFQVLAWDRQKKGWQGKSVKLASIYQSVKMTVIQNECMIYLL